MKNGSMRPTRSFEASLSEAKNTFEETSRLLQTPLTGTETHLSIPLPRIFERFASVYL
jgi:hypothetical protein